MEMDDITDRLKAKHIDRCLTAGSDTGRKPRPLHVSQWTFYFGTFSHSNVRLRSGNCVCGQELVFRGSAAERFLRIRMSVVAIHIISRITRK